MKIYGHRFLELALALVLVTLACALLAMPQAFVMAINCLFAAAFINLVGPLFEFEDEDV